MSSESEYMPPLRGLRVMKSGGEFFVGHHTTDPGGGFMTVGLSPKTFDSALSMIGVLESHPIFQHVDWKGDEDDLYEVLTLSNLHAIKELDRAYAKAGGGATP